MNKSQREVQTWSRAVQDLWQNILNEGVRRLHEEGLESCNWELFEPRQAHSVKKRYGQEHSFYVETKVRACLKTIEIHDLQTTERY